MNAPRILFVFSADYGEVINADLFIRGQGIEACAMSPAGGVVDASPVFARCAAYRTVDDIAACIDRTRPDLVVMASAYLLTVNDLLTPGQVTSLVERGRRGGWRLATTDPWMGYWRSHPNARFRLFGFGESRIRQSAEQAMRRHQSDLDELLDDVVHLYATPYVDQRRESYSFFNSVAPPAHAGDCGVDGGVLFVLSREDYKVQLRRHKDEFHRRLSRCFARMLGDGRPSITLIAPADCAARLRELPLPAAVNCPGFVGFADFRHLVETAGLVIYWNLLSTSLLYAYYARRPIAFLDIGHQAELSDGLADHAVRHVYDGRYPPVADLEHGDPAAAACRFDRLRGLPGDSPRHILENIRNAAAAS